MGTFKTSYDTTSKVEELEVYSRELKKKFPILTEYEVIKIALQMQQTETRSEISKLNERLYKKLNYETKQRDN